MAGTRLQISFDGILSLLVEPGVQAEIERITTAIDTATDSDSRVDYQTGMRFRGAVIAGYEAGATAESTRDALVRGLDGARE